jgi:hypothetical protein
MTPTPTPSSSAAQRIGTGHPPVSTPQNAAQGGDPAKESLLYKEFVAERDEILRHKWLESEKAGHDIGFEKALLDWVLRYRAQWRLQRSGGGGLAGAR